jgi:hypothetical protein
MQHQQNQDFRVIQQLSIIESLNKIPKHQTVSLLIRHAAREPIQSPEMAFVAGLTVQGIKDSQVFGQQLRGNCQPGSIFSSPVGRCVQTAEGIILGAQWQKPVLIDERLTHDFIRVALDAMSISRQSLGVPDQVIKLFSLLCGSKGEVVKDRLNIFVTHDTVVKTMLGYLISLPSAQLQFPEFLEGFFLWREGKVYRLLWRGQMYQFKLTRILGL